MDTSGLAVHKYPIDKDLSSMKVFRESFSFEQVVFFLSESLSILINETAWKSMPVVPQFSLFLYNVIVFW